MSKRRSVLLFSAVKAAITVSLILIIFVKIDFSSLARHLSGGAAVYFLLGTLMLAANVLLVATRWWLLLRRLHVATVSLGYALAGTYASVFVAQATPGPIGADAVRGWVCYGRGVKLRVIIMSLLTDRLLGLVGVLAVAASVWWWQFGAVERHIGRQIVVLAAIVAMATAAALWLAPALIAKLAKRGERWGAWHELPAMFRATALSPAGGLGLVLSCFVVTLTVNSVMLLAQGLGITLLPSVAYLVVPAAVLSAALPISIGGWGVREASLSYGLMLFGAAPDNAALLALAFGAGTLLASLPGGIVMLLLGGRLRPALGSAEAGLAE